MIVTFSRHGQTWELDTDELPSLEYLLQYGMSQSCQDSIAGVGTKVWEELAVKGMKQLELVAADKTKPFAEFKALLQDPANDAFRKDFEALVKQETVKTEIAQIEKRVAAILEDKVGSRSGSGDDAIWVEMKAIGRANMSAWCKAKGYKPPKDRDAYNSVLEGFLKGEYAEIVREEATANVERAAAFKAKMAGVVKA